MYRDKWYKIRFDGQFSPSSHNALRPKNAFLDTPAMTLNSEIVHCSTVAPEGEIVRK